MKQEIAQKMRRAKERIENRHAEVQGSSDSGSPVFTNQNIKYEIGGRQGGVAMGGIGAMHKFVKSIGLDREIDENLHLLKIHKPYHESDHVLNFAYNALCGGKVIDDIDHMRNDENFLDAIGARAVPDPTTAGDFCRRFNANDIHTLMDVINEKRKEIWAKQPAEFLEVAKVDGDGSILPTTGEKKRGMDISYKGIWGYHPLLISLANTGEPLYIVNRSGNVPSHDQSATYFDKAVSLLKSAHFRKILLRGDTDFALTTHFDRWDGEGVYFVFGYDARKNLIETADLFEEDDWDKLTRRAANEFEKPQRLSRENIKQEIIIKRGFENIRLKDEDILEFLYQPMKCSKEYRIVAVRKNLTRSKAGKLLFEDTRYFFYITNDDSLDMFEVVKESCDRCNQENLIEQQKNGVHAFRAPLDTLEANWAWMVMTSLAWTLKAWMALSLPVKGHDPELRRKEAKEVLRMEFRTFINSFMRIPAQIIKTGRRLIFRLMAWNPRLPILFRFLDTLT